MATIITKNSSTASSVPTNAQLVQGELAVNVTDKRLFTENASGTVVELGTNPSSLALPNGSVNGVPYLNASKVLTTGSALTFDGQNMTISGANSSLNVTGSTGLFLSGSYAGSAYLTTTSTNTATEMIFGTGTAVPIRFIYNNSEQMRLTSTGLGIGTSSPGAALHVQRSSANAVFRLSSSGGTGRDWNINSQADGHLTIGSDLISGQLDLYAGNLGLGVTPSALLWPNGSTGGLQLQDGGLLSAYNATTYLSNNWYYNAGEKYIGNGYATRYEQTQGKHAWYYAGNNTSGAGATVSWTQAMTLDANGNLGIATTSPGQKLDVNGNIKIGYGQSYMWGSVYALTYDSSDNFIFKGAGNAERARIDSSGNLLVGQTSAGFANLDGQTLYKAATYINHVSGTASGNYYIGFGYNGAAIGSITQNGTTAVAYNTSSDYRLKNITGPITNSGAYIDSLKPCEGTWKADGSVFVGLIAHEAQEVSRTQVATGVKDGEQMQGMDYSSSEIIANLIAELQSVRKRLAALEAK